MKGIFLNIDINTVTFPFLSRVAAQETVTEADLYPFVDQYAGTQVTDLAFNIFCQISMTESDAWSDVLDVYYRKKENGVDVDYKEIMEHYHRLYEIHKIDPHAVWLARCREKGIRPWLSVRMNDCHCPDVPAVWIRGSEFYEADEKGFKIGDAYGYQRHCYDYANEEFSRRMLAYLEEQVTRYDTDGLELDFSREWYCFNLERTPDPAPIMTAFVREVKKILRRAERKWGHPLLLHVRFMRDIEGNRIFGFDAAAMIEEGLIDSLSVAPRWATNDSHMPIAEWRAAFPDFPIYAGITDLTILQFVDHRIAAGYAASYLSQGADKIYLYNFFNDPEKPNADYARMHRTCGDLQTLVGAPRRMIVTRQDITPNDRVFVPLPAKANGFTLPLPTGPIHPSETLSLVLGFFREVSEEEITVTLDGIPATLTGKTDIGRIYAESTSRFDGVSRADGLYIFALPSGCTAGNPVLSVKAEDDTLSLSYIEILIGDLPADEASKGARK